MSDTNIKKISQALSPPPESPPAFNPKGKANRSILEPPKSMSAPTPETKPAPTTPNTKSRFGPAPGAPQEIAPQTPRAPTQSRNVSTSFKIPAVMEMQNAILNFADIASSTDATSLTGSGQKEGPQTREFANTPESEKEGDDVDGIPTNRKDEKKEYLGGTDPFGKFIIKNYIGGDPVGKTYLNVDVKGENLRDEAAMEHASLKGLIDSIKRIGTPGSEGTEKSSDGRWGARTTNSLKNIFALINGMINFSQHVNLSDKIEGYNSDKLNQFKELISFDPRKSNSEEISKRASEITKHLKEMTEYFKNVNIYVFKNKNLKKYIMQEEPFTKYETGPKQNAFVLQGKLPFFPANAQNNYISLQDLSSYERFSKFVEREFSSDPRHKDPQFIQQILNEVEKALENASPSIK